MAYTFRHGDRPLDGMTVQRAVGRGGFGEVYYALSDAGKQLALKYLRDNPDVELRGIAHVMNLKSPHLITIYDVRTSIEGDPFVIMEYVSGPSLRDVMSAEPEGFSAEKAAFFLNGIAQGLSYLHERGIVHRDLKPGNIFYDDGYVKIGDYGLSKHISVSQHSGNTVSVGTVHYMAPEIGSGSYTKAIDIYSLGIILYEMLTGRLPFNGSSMGEILMRHLNDNPDLRGLPEGFAPIISKALAKDPKERYENVDAMVDAVVNLGQIEARMSAFDPKTLTSVPRTDTDDAATRTSPAPPVPGMDARDVPSFDRAAAGAGETVQAGLNQLNEAIQDLDDKFSGDKHKRKKLKPGKTEYVPAPTKNRSAQIFTLFLVTIGVTVATTFFTNIDEEVAVSIFLFILLGVSAMLFAQLKLLANTPQRHWLFDRIVLTSAAAIAMAPGFVLADGNGQALGAGAGLLFVIFLFDWSRRIEAGRRGKISGDDAILPGIVGAIATARMDGNLIAGGMVAAVVSLIVQAAAGLWPLYRVRLGDRPDPPNPQPADAPKSPEPEQPVSVPPVPVTTTKSAPKQATAKAATKAVGVQPSFVGERTGTTTQLLGKLFLLIGFFVAFSAAYANVSTVMHWQHTEMHKLMTSISQVHWLGLWGIGIGVLFLAISRRSTSWLHVCRAVVAGALLLNAAFVVVVVGSQIAKEFSLHGIQAMNHGPTGAPVIVFALSLAVGLAILRWRHRPEALIVV